MCSGFWILLLMQFCSFEYVNKYLNTDFDSVIQLNLQVLPPQHAWTFDCWLFHNSIREVWIYWGQTKLQAVSLWLYDYFLNFIVNIGFFVYIEIDVGNPALDSQSQNFCWVLSARFECYKAPSDNENKYRSIYRTPSYQFTGSISWIKMTH